MPFIWFEAKVHIINIFAHRLTVFVAYECFSKIIGFSWVPHLCKCSCKQFLDFVHICSQFDKWGQLSWVSVHGTSQRPITATPLNYYISVWPDCCGQKRIWNCWPVKYKAVWLKCALHLRLIWCEFCAIWEKWCQVEQRTCRSYLSAYVGSRFTQTINTEATSSLLTRPWSLSMSKTAFSYKFEYSFSVLVYLWCLLILTLY